MYMDDMKIFALKKVMETLIQTIKIYSQDIGIDFGLESWKKEAAEGIELSNQENIKTAEEKENYKWEYCKRAQSKRQRWGKKLEKSTSEEQENISKTKTLLLKFY